MRSSSRQACASAVRTSGSSGGAVFHVGAVVTARSASTRRRSRGGITWHHLRQRAHPCLLDAGHRALRHRLHADGQRDGLLVVDHERRQRGAAASW